MAGNFDLFGDPVPDGWGKRGRPPHVVTEEKRCKVMLLLAIGRKSEEIAAALGITPPTLRKKYFRELRGREEARFRVEGTNLLRLYEQAEAGNVAAIKELRKVLEKAEMLDSKFARPSANEPSKKKKLGKKEQALADAQAPDTSTTLGDLMAQRARPN